MILCYVPPPTPAPSKLIQLAPPSSQWYMFSDSPTHANKQNPWLICEMTDGIFQGREKQKRGKDNQLINQKGGIHCQFKIIKVIKNNLKL